MVTVYNPDRYYDLIDGRAHVTSIPVMPRTTPVRSNQSIEYPFIDTIRANPGVSFHPASIDRS